MSARSAVTGRYAIGIDLGTTNSALAFARLPDDPTNTDPLAVEVLDIPQLIAPGTVESRPLLPSFMYLAAEAEARTGTLGLPWSKRPEYAVGTWARSQSADVPTRTVAAAKSWLSQSRYDRRQPLLPFNAPADVPRVSPVVAAQRYLEHLVAAWQAAHPEAPIVEQEVVVTVPASFDAAARELTHEAALAAGLPATLTLLEEPQAAVYAWLAATGERWRRQVQVDDTLLVCDVGGGTTDFTLIRVAQEQGELFLQRAAVGNHLLVGGDNMDLALAHHLSTAFAAKKVTLDPWQAVSLWHACRAAKETLLGSDPPKKHPVSVLGRGSKLIGGTVSIDLERTAVTELLVDGFFPHCDITARPVRQRASGFRQLGLPYENDPAVTRHLAEFLSQHGTAPGRPAQPTQVLFNGGVFRAETLRTRLFDVLRAWFPGAAPRGLEGNADLDLAVARGAAYYAAVKRGRGVRIRGGTARSYYVGIETAGLAIPGAPRPLNAVCVVPFGMEEGTAVEVPTDEIGLVVGEPAQFRFFSSAVRKTDTPGQQLDRWTEDELAETDPLEALLPAPSAGNSTETSDAQPAGAYVPVRFESRITELGMFELWCVSQSGDQRWKLEFSVRDDADVKENT